MVPTASEASAIAAFADAWTAYFAGASVQGIAAVPAPLEAAKSAMQGAMVGMSQDSQGPQKIQDGVTAFWNTVAGSAPTIWLPVPNTVVPGALVPPPGLSGIASALQAVFSSNMAANHPLATAMSNVATSLHSNGGLGGTVTVQPPPTAPPVPGVPIL